MARIENLDAKLQSVQEESEELVALHAEAERQIANLIEENIISQRRNNELNQQLTEAQSIIKSLEMKVNRNQDSKDGDHKQSIDPSIMNSTSQDDENEVLRSRQLEEELKESSDIIKLLQEEAMEMQRELDMYKQESSKQGIALLEDSEKAKKIASELTSQLESAKLELSELQSQHLSLRKEFESQTEYMSTLITQLRDAQMKSMTMENDELSTLSQNLRLTETKVFELESQVTQKEEELINMKKRMQGLEEQLSLAQDEVMKKSTQIQDLTNQLSATNLRVEEIEPKLNEAQNEAKSLQDSITIYEEKINHMEHMLKEAEKTNDSDAIRSIENRLQDAIRRAESAEAGVATANLEIQALQRGLDERKVDLDEVKMHLDKAIQEKQHLQNTMSSEDLEFKLKQALEQNEELNKKFQEAKLKIVEMESQLSDYNRIIEELHAAGNNQDLQTRLEELENTLKETQLQVQKAQMEVIERENEVLELRDQLQDLDKEDIKSVNDGDTASNSAISPNSQHDHSVNISYLQEELSNRQIELEEFKRQLEELNRNLEEKTQSLEESQRSDQSNQELVKELNEIIHDHEITIDHLNNELRAAQHEALNSNQLFNKQSADIVRLQSDIKVAQDAIERLTQEAHEQAEKANELQTSLDEANVTIKDLQTELAEKSHALIGLQKELEQEKLDKANSQIDPEVHKALNEKLINFEKDIEESQEALKLVQVQLSDSQAALLRSKKDADNANEAIMELSNEMMRLKQENHDQDSQIKELRIQIDKPVSSKEDLEKYIQQHKEAEERLEELSQFNEQVTKKKLVY